MSSTVPNIHTATAVATCNAQARNSLLLSVPSGLRPGSGNVCPVSDCDHVVGEEVPGAHFLSAHINPPFLWMSVFSFGLDVASYRGNFCIRKNPSQLL